MGRNCADAVNALVSLRLSAVSATRTTCALPFTRFELTRPARAGAFLFTAVLLRAGDPATRCALAAETFLAADFFLVALCAHTTGNAASKHTAPIHRLIPLNRSTFFS
jgi:hypothetical protein